MMDPGHDTDLKVATDVRMLTGVWVGGIGMGQTLRDGRVRPTGPTRSKRDTATWLGGNDFADIRPAV